MINACTRLLRGSGYVGFDGEVPADPIHSALASEYAHVTAPLRRLGDRYAGEICVALCAGTEVPGWVLEKLHVVPETMRDSGRRAAPVRSGGPRPGRGRRAAAPGGGDVRGRHRRPRRPGRQAGHGHRAGPGRRGTRHWPTRPLPLGTDVHVTLAQADVASRAVGFRLAKGLTALPGRLHSVRSG